MKAMLKWCEKRGYKMEEVQTYNGFWVAHGKNGNTIKAVSLSSLKRMILKDMER